MMLLILLLGFHQVISESVTVVTPKGSVVGQTASDGNYATFFGVPYAKVDEGNPFGNTLDYPDFENPFIASDQFVKCPQVFFAQGGVLQCLILNIYVPKTNHTALPVFVWIHGGGFAFGSAGEYNPKHLIEQDVIVITANYRQGPYGFFCTSDTKNQGIKDLKTALRWVQNNIKSFGGDPNQVTIGGESYGAGVVGFLLYSDAPFNQAILESGTRFSFGITTNKDNDAPLKLATKLGSNFTNYRDAVDFLKTADPLAVMGATRDLGYSFGVCERPGEFILKHKLKKIKQNVSILIGYNSKESFAEFVNQPELFYANVRNIFFNNLRRIFSLKDETINDLADTIFDFYLGEKRISVDSMLELIDLASDFRVNYGAERATTIYLTEQQNPKVYKYIFSYIGGSEYKNITGVGAHHTEELRYLFEWGAPLQTEEQFEIRRWMVKLWTNFIKYGDPSPNHGANGWLPTNLATRQYLNIDVHSEMRNHVNHQRMAFWKLLWTAYGRYKRNLPGVPYM